MQAISDAGLTLNPAKCLIGTKVLGIINSEGDHPDPVKVAALNHITLPHSKDGLINILCMMQANAEFIPNFTQKSKCFPRTYLW